MPQSSTHAHTHRHHTGYYTKLTAFAKEKEPELLDMTNEEIIRAKECGPIFNLAAQIYNHDFYWQSMSPKASEPTGALLERINEDFGSLDALKQQFQGQCETHFGSGWVWLVQDKTTKKISVVNTHDAGTPITDANVQPLLVCDVWEHAFYIDYRNAKPTYATNFWQVANWNFAESNLVA